MRCGRIPFVNLHLRAPQLKRDPLGGAKAIPQECVNAADWDGIHIPRLVGGGFIPASGYASPAVWRADPRVCFCRRPWCLVSRPTTGEGGADQVRHHRHGRRGARIGQSRVDRLVVGCSRGLRYTQCRHYAERRSRSGSCCTAELRRRVWHLRRERYMQLQADELPRERRRAAICYSQVAGRASKRADCTQRHCVGRCRTGFYGDTVDPTSLCLQAVSRPLRQDHSPRAPPNKRLEAGGARRLWNESFFSAPQLKRDPLGRRELAWRKNETIFGY
jgi:hypothetical protein